MLRQLRPAILMVLVMTVLTGFAFPLLVTGIAQVAFRRQADGSLVYRNGKAVGSGLIGQAFAGPAYFHPRPSAAGSGYDALASGGSNLGPTSRKLVEDTAAAAAAYRRENGLPSGALIPVDAVTRSASGLDPDISPANARLQARRIALARGLSAMQVLGLVQRNIEHPVFGFVGEPRVNVLKLNLALDALKPAAR